MRWYSTWIYDSDEMKFTIENRSTGRSVVLLAKPKPKGSEKGEKYYLHSKYEDLFEVVDF